jgi:hypothetical protein
MNVSKLLLVFAAFGFAQSILTVHAAPGSPAQVRIEYVRPKSSALEPLYEQIKQRGALEFAQKLLKPLLLPRPLKLRLSDCDGVANAWYADDVITVCYELLDQFLKNAPAQDLPIGISKADTILGPALDTLLHETGHAVFRMWDIPVLGREEDAADQFSAYVMLRLDKGEARRMILGSAYQYKLYMPDRQATVPITAFSDEHSLPAQRAYNILCLAYGSEPTVFADIVEKGFLPKQRADICALEYGDIAFAFKKLIRPHIDKKLAKEAHKVWTREATRRRAYLTNETLDTRGSTKPSGFTRR